MTVSTNYEDVALIRIARGLFELRPSEQFVRQLLETDALKPHDGDVGREAQRLLYGLIAHATRGDA